MMKILKNIIAPFYTKKSAPHDISLHTHTHPGRRPEALILSLDLPSGAPLILHRATQGVLADFLDPPGTMINDLYLIIHAVEGLPGGSYVFDRDQQRLELLQAGNFRDRAGYLGLEQQLPADASVDVFLLADLETVLQRYGNRGYRAAQLEGGLIGGKLYLGAYAQRIGASGLTFFDDDVTDFFSPHAEGKSVMFLVALGHPVRRKLVG